MLDKGIQDISKKDLPKPNSIDLTYVLETYKIYLAMSKSSFKYLINLNDFSLIINFIDNIARKHQNNDKLVLQLIILSDNIKLFDKFISDIIFINKEIEDLLKKLEAISYQGALFKDNIPDDKMKNKFIETIKEIENFKIIIKIFKNIYSELTIFEKTFSSDPNKLLPVLKQIIVHLNKLETNKLKYSKDF